MKPETPLPWKELPYGESWVGSTDTDSVCVDGPMTLEDEEFALHACNAYPKLVEALKLADLERRYRLGPNAIAFKKLLEELGEEAE